MFSAYFDGDLIFQIGLRCTVQEAQNAERIILGFRLCLQ